MKIDVMSWCLCFGSNQPRAAEETDHEKKCKSSPGNDRLPIEPKAQLPPKDVLGALVNINAQRFAYEMLARVTNGFSKESLIGEGGFGQVYGGKLETGQVVAVKKLDISGHQGDREFLAEVVILSRLRHPNLVNLIGFCAEGPQRLLVYEYMPLGCLEDHLHDLPPDTEPLSFNMRLMIAAGAAKGLNFLHNGANPPIIYRDLKTSNILLDDGFQPKLSDFGLAKHGPTGDRSHVSTRVMGTHGYCAPEYADTGKLTAKSDIYSFGVVLLELITGRRALDNTMRYLVDWARPLLSDRKTYSQLADPLMQGRYSASVFKKLVEVTSMCLRENAAARPPIKDVVQALDYLVKLSLQGLSPATSSPVQGHKHRIEEVETEYNSNNSPRSPEVEVHKHRIEEVEMEYSSNNNSPQETTRMLNRKQAVAEARLWGESWRAKNRQTA